MLHIRVKKLEDSCDLKPKAIKQEQNISKLFDRVIIPDNAQIRKVIKEIDCGKLVDGKSFIDRFGFRVDIDNLSTGCKAAILTFMNPGDWIDLTSAGLNARDSIIRNFRNGKIILPEEGVTIAYPDGEEDADIDVGIYGYRITSLKRLNSFLFEEWEGEHDMSTGQIERFSDV